MSNAKPDRRITIRQAVDIYTIMVFFGVAVFLFFLGTERYRDFVASHQHAADKATQVAVREIREIIANKRHVVRLFSEDNYNQIFALSRDPENFGLYADLNSKISRNIPDFFASNIITTSGELVIGNFDNKVSDLCLQDMAIFAEYGKQNIRVHPNVNVYHYDILTRMPADDEEHIFFVSFNLNEIADLLNTVQPSLHELMLVNYDMQGLIEIVETGGRDTIKERDDFRLTEEEKSRIMSSRPIEGTMWHIVDFQSPGLLEKFNESLIMEYLIVYFIFGLSAFYMRTVLLSEDNRRQQAEEMLRQSNDKITALNEKLEHLSLTDSLTGLYNRRYVDQRLPKEWARCQRVGASINIALIDIDYFKKYNDYYGHQAGDDCLDAVSDAMRLIFKRAGDIIARYGGEEFIVVMTDVSADEARDMLLQFQKTLESMNIAHATSSAGDHVTVSAGVFHAIPTKSDQIEDAIRRADEALYSAKSEGRNRIVVFDNGPA